MTNITILGSGFGALTAVRELRRLRVEADITVVSPRDELHYLPSSIWIPTGVVKGEDLKVPLRRFFKRKKVKFVQASAYGAGRRRPDSGDRRRGENPQRPSRSSRPAPVSCASCPGSNMR